MAKVNPGFNQVLYKYGSQSKSPQGTPAMYPTNGGGASGVSQALRSKKVMSPHLDRSEGKPRSVVKRAAGVNGGSQ